LEDAPVRVAVSWTVVPVRMVVFVTSFPFASRTCVVMLGVKTTAEL
jgi:hypothetical protein